MGIFDSLFGTNTDASTQAAVSNGQSDLWTGATDANRVLDNATLGAGNAYTAGAAGATGAVNAGYNQARSDIAGGGAQAQGQLAGGANSAIGMILGGNTGYAPFLTSGQGANAMYANALGLNGQAGHDAATAAFQASPGYQFQVDQGTDTAARKAASLGMAGSGNTLSAITSLSSNLANQEYGNWLSNLSGLSGQGLTAAAGSSANNQLAGNVAYNAGSTGAQLTQSAGNTLGSLGVQQGNALGGIQSGLGNALGGLQTSRGQSEAGNIFNAAGGSANLGIQGAQLDDQTANANASIFSSLLGTAGKIGAVGALNPSGLKL